MPNDGGKPDALMELVRNAFTVMMTLNSGDHSDLAATATAENGGQDNENATTLSPVTVDDMLEVLLTDSSLPRKKKSH